MPLRSGSMWTREARMSAAAPRIAGGRAFARPPAHLGYTGRMFDESPSRADCAEGVIRPSVFRATAFGTKWLGQLRGWLRTASALTRRPSRAACSGNRAGNCRRNCSRQDIRRIRHSAVGRIGADLSAVEHVPLELTHYPRHGRAEARLRVCHGHPRLARRQRPGCAGQARA
jgi:hypothetical protein